MLITIKQKKMSLKEIQKRVFDGCVPVSFEIEGESMPFVLNVPRIIPLGTFVHHNFATFIGEKCQDLWFSVNDTPVKCYLPVGVTYDLFSKKGETIDLLTIKIHKSEIPEKTVQRCETLATADWLFCQSFKESVFLTQQNQNLLLENPNLHQRILKNVFDRNFEEFCQLFEIRTSSLSEMKYTPIKLIRKSGAPKNIFVENKEGLTLKEVLNDETISSVICQGIELPLETKISDIIPSLLYPDSFIYVTCE